MYNTYILLRNNSESTSLNLEDLKRIGILPTDQFWVECQSVCWQHPNEIPELKQLLAETAQIQTKPVQTVSGTLAKEDPLEKYAPQVEKDQSCIKLPTKGNSLKVKEEDNTSLKQDLSDWKKETNTAHTVTTNHKAAGLTLNDTLLNGDNKEPWVRHEAPKEKKDLMEILLSLPAKKIATYAGLVIAGALMMLVIRGTGANGKMKPPPITQQTETENTVPAEELVDEPAADSTVVPESYTPQITPATELTDTPTEEPPVSELAKKTIPAKKTTDKNETTPPVSEPPVSNPPPVAEKKEVKKMTAENIASKLQLKANEYNVAAFGGIRNLKMTLQNDSRYLLDKVSVELRYLNPEGAVVKTEVIDFNFVQPGGEVTVAVKKTSRGVKVDYKITHIESKELAATNAVTENNTYSKN
ncbi:MAG: hypothetical protein ABL876_05990 [Chitinophagaceae bacterium]